MGRSTASANDAEFDSLYRKHLTEIYNALGEPAPDALAHPIKRAPNGEARAAFGVSRRAGGRAGEQLFEWLGAGLYATDRQSGAMHGRQCVLGEFYYGFGEDHLWLRVDPIPEAIAEMTEFQLRLTLWDSRETRITLHVKDRKLAGCVVEHAGMCLLHPETDVSAAYGKIMEVRLSRELFDLRGRRELLISVALWEGGLPVDVMPVEGMLEVALGEENFAWGVEVAAD